MIDGEKPSLFFSHSFVVGRGRVKLTDDLERIDVEDHHDLAFAEH